MEKRKNKQTNKIIKTVGFCFQAKVLFQPPGSAQSFTIWCIPVRYRLFLRAEGLGIINTVLNTLLPELAQWSRL